MLVVDGSGSIGTSEFPKVKEFLKLIVNKSEVGETKNQFGMIQFSDRQWSEFHLNTHHSNQAVKGNNKAKLVGFSIKNAASAILLYYMNHEHRRYCSMPNSNISLVFRCH